MNWKEAVHLLAGSAKHATHAYRFESQMLPSLRRCLPSLAFSRSGRDRVSVFAEVPAVAGVPDLVAVRFDMATVERRVLEEIAPLSSETEVRLAMEAKKPIPLSGAGALVGLSDDYVRRSVIPLMREKGWLIKDGTHIVRAPSAAFVGERVVTVEAKLRDWHRAFSQARRQRWSADAAYIALPANLTTSLEGNLAAIGARGIGVIALDDATGVTRVLVRPARVSRSKTAVGRALLSERTLEMYARGEMDGPVSPVFGWVLPEHFWPQREV